MFLSYWASQQWASGASAVSSVVTDTGTTPTTTALTVDAANTAVRVWLGDQSVAEGYFYLYVKRNAVTSKVKVYRYSAPIFHAAAGDTFAFATTDGRTIQVSQMGAPAALITSFPVSGSALCDKAGPPLWSPTAAHVQLAQNNSAFSITPTGTDLPVFISELAPSGWTPARFVMLHRTRATVIQCTYRQVALANFPGTALTVTAPSGSVIGGTSTQMHLTFPGGTGTVHEVTTVANLKTALAAAVSGDIINIAAGTYALDVAITNATFAANGSSAKGILIRGATGIRGDVILTGNVSGTNGAWTLTGGPSAAEPIMFKDLTFSFATLTGTAFTVNTGGYALFENVRWTGPTTGATDLLLWNNSATAIVMDALWCQADNAGADCFNGAGTAAQNAASLVRLIGCDGDTPSNVSSSQCVTSHTGLAVQIWGGTYKNANTNVWASDGASTQQYAFFARAEVNARAAGTANTSLFGCYVEGTAANGIAPSLYALFTYFNAPLGATGTVFRNVAATIPVESNYATVSTAQGRGVFNDNTSGNLNNVRYNIFDDFGDCLRCSSSVGAGGTSQFYGNTLLNAGNGIFEQDTNMLVTIKNNACKGNTNGVNVTAAAMALITTNYNTIDPAIDVDFVPGANDITNADAALDSAFFPTASGNCDNNGDTSVEDWIGGRDPWGFVYNYGEGVVSRGARARPVIRASAVLFPDVQ